MNSQVHLGSLLVSEFTTVGEASLAYPHLSQLHALAIRPAVAGKRPDRFRRSPHVC